MFIALLLFFILTLICIVFYKPICNRITLKKIPCPPGLPILGHFLDFYQSTPDVLFSKIRKYARKNGHIYRLTVAHTDIVNLSNPEDIEQILSTTTHLSKSKVYSFLEGWLGTGLLQSTGEKWHRRRKILTPAFHFNILQEFLVIFNEETQKLVKELENICENTSDVEVLPLMTQFALQSVGETALGFKNVDKNFLRIYKENVLKMGAIFYNRMIRPWLRNDFIYGMTWRGRHEKEVIKILHTFSNTVIRSREEEFNKMQDEPSYDDTGKKKRLAMLDLLLKAKSEGANIDHEGIREEVDTFMFEGHDTTSTAIVYILFLLANHPDVQEKVYEEIEEVLKEEETNFSYFNLQNLTYMERCIKECLRLYPSVPFISRYAGVDYVTTTGYKIPKGTIVHIHIFDLHRNPNVYPDPEKFDPDRFLLDVSNSRHPFAYLPFSAGPRNCIGQKFAMLELKTVISGIMKKFRLEAIDTPKDVILQTDIILKQKNVIKIKFLPR